MKAPEIMEIDGSLKTMQRLVGGTIQAVYPFDDDVALVCNDDGKILSKPLNRALYEPHSRKLYDIIAGNFFICGAPKNSDNFTSLSNQQIEHYSKLYQSPEIFISINGKVVAFPIP